MWIFAILLVSKGKKKMSNISNEIDIIRGILTIPPMTPNEILKMRFHCSILHLTQVRVFRVSGNVCHTKEFPGNTIDSKEDFVSYLFDNAVTNTIHYIGRFNDMINVVLSESKDNQTNIDADVIEHLANEIFYC